MQLSIAQSATRLPVTYLAAKRAIDIAGSVVGILALSPVLPLVAMMIKLDSRGPVFFNQIRLGRFGKLFRMYKFRSMAHQVPEIQNPDGSRFVGKNDARLTRIGRFLRDCSIDELPQLLNVLKGDMSLVGPRPDQPGPDLQLEIFQKKRLMKPGLTSLATISGRNAIPWRERVALDVDYVENASLKLDAFILWKTIAIVLRREGIYTGASQQG